MATKNLLIRGGADFSGVQREVAKVQQTLLNFQARTSSIMKKIGFVLAGLGVGKLIKESTQMAMEVEAALQQIKRIMGESTNQFLKWANTQAIAFNMSKAEALKYGSVFGNLISGFTSGTKETMKYTQDLLKASSIIASATGRSMQDVMERIRSGMLGSTEAIEDLGVNVNVAMLESTEAFKKFANGKSWNQLSFQTQQQIRLMAILEQTSKKYGDTVSQNTSSQLQQLVAHLNNVKLSLGQAFLPIVQIVLPILTSLAQKLSYVMGVVAQFSQALFGKAMGGKQAQNTQAQAKAMTNLGNATEKAGKQAKGALAGFDEINNLADNSDSGADGTGIDSASIGTGIDSVGINFETNAPEISAEIQSMAENAKAKIKSITDTIQANKEIIISVIAGIVAAFATFKTITFITNIPTIIGAIGTALSVLLTPIGIASIAIGALVASFLYLYQTNEDFRNDINSIWSDISKTINSFVNNTLKPIFNYIINDFLAPLGKAFKDYILPVLSEVFIGASKILNDMLEFWAFVFDKILNDVLKPALELIKTIIIDTLELIKKLWDKYGQALITNLRSSIKGVQETFQLIWDNIINPIIKPALAMLTWLWEKHLKGLVEEVGTFVMKLVNGALELYNGFIKPIVDWMVVELGPGIANTVTFIGDVFGTLVAWIADLIKALFKILSGLVDFIVGVFTGNWEKAWQGVKDIFGGIWDAMVDSLKASMNLIIDCINFLLRAWNKIHFTVPSITIPGLGTIGGGTIGVIQIPEIPKLAKGGITNGPMLAMIGDNPGGKEVVSPLDNLMDMISTAVGNAMISSSQFNSNNQEINLNLNIDGTTFARATYSYNQKESSRIGNAMITAS